MKVLQVLFIASPEELARIEPLVAGVRRVGHRVQVALDVDEALGLPTPDCLVVTCTAGHGLLLAFDLPEAAPQRIALLNRRDFDAATEALRAGADELLVRPTVAELVATIRPRARKPLRITTPRRMQESYLVGGSLTAATARPVLDLLAFATRLGLERSWRLRVGTALGLAVDNVVQHAYPDTEGPLELSAAIAGDHLTITITDRGVGFEPSLSGEPGTVRGLDLMASLAERVDLSSSPAGTSLCLEFHLAPTRFDEQPVELDELDYLDPATCRALLTQDGHEPASGALLPTLGRLLGAMSRTTDPTTCLSA